MRLIVQASLAASDVREQTDFLASRDAAIALKFIEAIERAYRQIQENPSSGFCWNFTTKRLQGTRVKTVPGFRNQLIFFQEFPDSVRILRVLHASRDIAAIFRELS